MRRFLLGSFFGLLVGCTGTLVAQSVVRWQKEEVTPMVIVEPWLGRFVPKDGTALQASWNKSEVVPVCFVKPGIGGFVPTEGSAIGNVWSKQEVKPFIAVEYFSGHFQPVQ